MRSYKDLSKVERAFRSTKTVDLKIRPIHHRLADRVRSHVFLCVLAYYVEWHMRQALAPILFDDDDPACVPDGSGTENMASRYCRQPALHARLPNAWRAGMLVLGV